MHVESSRFIGLQCSLLLCSQSYIAVWCNLALLFWAMSRLTLRVIKGNKFLSILWLHTAILAACTLLLNMDKNVVLMARLIDLSWARSHRYWWQSCRSFPLSFLQADWSIGCMWPLIGNSDFFAMPLSLVRWRCFFLRLHMGRVKRTWYLWPMRAAKVQESLRIRAVSPEPSLLAHTSNESRGTFRQKARSLAPLNGRACAVEICHDGMLEDTNSLGGAHICYTRVTIRAPLGRGFVQERRY